MARYCCIPWAISALSAFTPRACKLTRAASFLASGVNRQGYFSAKGCHKANSRLGVLINCFIVSVKRSTIP